MEITLEQLTHGNYSHALEINRDDIPEAWVDNASYLMDLTDYGEEHHLIGHTYLARLGTRYIGIILIGEAIPWDTDPDEMKGRPFYRIMGFVVDRNYRSRGIGGEILEKAVRQVYDEFGPRPLALGVHSEIPLAVEFYLRHVFRPTGVYEGNDEYYLRLNA